MPPRKPRSRPTESAGDRVLHVEIDVVLGDHGRRTHVESTPAQVEEAARLAVVDLENAGYDVRESSVTYTYGRQEWDGAAPLRPARKIRIVRSADGA